MDRKWLTFAAGGSFLLLLAGGAWAHQDATDASNPYSIIAERNVFHLNPPPPPAPPPDTTKADLPVIKITGIVRIGDQTRALFVSEPKDKKDNPTYFNLAEGERQGILEVVKIDPVGQKVEVINSGARATLTIKDDSLAKSEGSPPEGAAGPGERRLPGERHLPAFPGSAGRFPRPGFPGQNIPGVPSPASPLSIPMRSVRRGSYGQLPQ